MMSPDFIPAIASTYFWEISRCSQANYVIQPRDIIVRCPNISWHLSIQRSNSWNWRIFWFCPYHTNEAQQSCRGTHFPPPILATLFFQSVHTACDHRIQTDPKITGVKYANKQIKITALQDLTNMLTQAKFEFDTHVVLILQWFNLSSKTKLKVLQLKMLCVNIISGRLYWEILIYFGFPVSSHAYWTPLRP